MSTKYINAGAGSGKTYRLTHDLAEKLVNGNLDTSRIILTTFTKAAAADFVRKAREVLIKDYNNPAKAAELDSALIGTVHSVCERFVKKYWYRLGLTLPLNIIQNEDKKMFISRTAENVVSDSDVSFFTQLAVDYDMSPDFWKKYLKTIVELKHSFGVDSLSESCEISCQDIAEIFTEDASDKIDCLDTFLKTMIDSIDVMNRDRVANNKKPQQENTQKAAKSILAARSVFKKATKVYDWAEEGLSKSKGFWKTYFDDTTLSEVRNAASVVLLSKTIGDEWQKCVRMLFNLAEKWEEEYTAFKAESRLLDFNDLEQKFLRILYEDEFEDVRADIHKSYDLMMVDEFQDSNPVQIKIFRKMMEIIDETVFVGDRKQAIFGFRGTESSLVEDFIKEIPNKESLMKSYRSRPSLVNVANTVFCKAFEKKQLPVHPDDPKKPYDGISLHPVRAEVEEMAPALQHWDPGLKSERSQSHNYMAVGKKIRDIVESEKWLAVQEDKTYAPIRYRDIAILLRNGKDHIKEVVRSFREAGVPVSIQESDYIGWAEVQLIISLVRFILDGGDKCAKADILHLIGAMSTEDIIKDSVSNIQKDSTDLLFQKLDDMRTRLSILSVSEIVESLILELDLFGNVADWGLSGSRMLNIRFMIGLAKQYEQQCANMNTAPSLAGYIQYVSEFEPESHPVDRTDTVKVLTYHSAKGLEWPLVILDELDSLKLDDQVLFKKDYGGICYFRKKEEKDVSLHFFPRFMSKDTGFSAPNLPQPLLDKLAKTSLFDFIKKRKVEEERRLLYVGFTRAKDYLVTLGNESSQYTWPIQCNAGQIPWLDENNNYALWHSDYPSEYYNLSLPDDKETQEDKPLKEWKVPEKVKLDDKYQSPSLAGHTTSVPVTLSEVFKGSEMEHNIGDKSDNTACGTCIHRIFAAYNPNKDRKELAAMAERIIADRGLMKEFPSPESVIASAEQFFTWLKKEYGAGTLLHEMPVMMKKEDKSVVRGEMDLVWELPDKKCILVDYKSYHGSPNLNSTDENVRKYYQGYAPQLLAYKNTLIKGEWKVVDVLVFYFIQGRGVRFVMG